MTNGGKRFGAGRPKGSKNKQTILESEARAILVQRLLEQWEAVIKTALSVALGKNKIVEIYGKQERIYTLPPNTKMLLAIIEFVIGKPKQSLEATINMTEMQKLSSDIQTILTNR